MNDVSEKALPAPAKSSFYPTFFLCLLLGGLGAHRFYTGKIKSGITQLVTFGGCGLWWLVDLLLLVLGKFKDKQNVAMPNANPKLTWVLFGLFLLPWLAFVGNGAGTISGITGLGNRLEFDSGTKIEGTVKLHSDVHTYDSSGWAGMEVAKLIWKTARKNPKASAIEVTLELKETLKDEYGKEVPEPHIMGTITESDLDEVRKYVSADAYATRLGGAGNSYGFSIHNMTYGWLLRKD